MENNTTDIEFIKEAIALSKYGMENNFGGPFGCVVVKDNVIVGRGYNKVTSTNDPTAHAEVVAIRDACKNLNDFQLGGCTIYTSCEPCPMCLAAIYWARPKAIVYACSKEDAASVNFDDAFIYKEFEKPIFERKIPSKQLLQEEAYKVMKLWEAKEGGVQY